MRTNYHTDQRPSYECSSRADRLTTPTCRSVAAATVDDAVAARAAGRAHPRAGRPGAVAADEVADRHQRVSRAAELAVERARYDADRAERAFCAVEPENRLVARSLEARWEARLAALAEAEQALEAAAEALPPLPSRADLEKLAADLPGLWHAPATSNKDRKRLLRTLIADVTLLPEPDRSKVRIGIRWHTGATDELCAARAIHPGTAKRSPSPAVEMVRELGPVTPTAELAEQLNAAGLVTGQRPPVRRQGRPVDPPRLQHPRPGPLRRRRDLRRRGRQPARLQHRRHLLLDRDRPARRPPRLGQPALHPLERPHRGRLPPADRRVRPPQPRGPPHQAPTATLRQPRMSVPSAMLTSPGPPTRT